MRNKILIFVVGIVAGVAIGVLFSVAIKELFAQFRELHISLNRMTLKQSQMSQRLDSIQGKLVPKPVTSSLRLPANTKHTTALPNVKNGNSPDSTLSDIDSPDSDIVVMTNELISVISVPLKNKDTAKVNKQTEKTDSALASMSDISISKEPSEYRIEFWKSPLNFKGYKMSRGKIIIYGINPAPPVKLVEMENMYYLAVNPNAYRLGYTDDFKSFEKITDKTTLNKLGL